MAWNAKPDAEFAFHDAGPLANKAGGLRNELRLRGDESGGGRHEVGGVSHLSGRVRYKLGQACRVSGGLRNESRHRGAESGRGRQESGGVARVSWRGRPESGRPRPGTWRARYALLGARICLSTAGHFL